MRYRCRVGHAYHEDNLVDAKGQEVEAALWTALETLDERADLLRRVADRMEGAGRNADGLRLAAGENDRKADLLRRALLSPDLHPA